MTDRDETRIADTNDQGDAPARNPWKRRGVVLACVAASGALIFGGAALAGAGGGAPQQGEPVAAVSNQPSPSADAQGGGTGGRGQPTPSGSPSAGGGTGGGSQAGVDRAQAERIARDAVSAPDATVTEIDSDTEDGRRIWEVELRQRNTEYEVDVDRATGNVLKSETDRDGRDDRDDRDDDDHDDHDDRDGRDD